MILATYILMFFGIEKSSPPPFKGFLLQENGGFLLQENGYRILI
jgi:hypothetical protein